MDYDDAPGSPPLPPPDSEVASRLPQGDISANDLDLDLNPDLELTDQDAVSPGGFIPDPPSEKAATPGIYDKKEDFQPTIIPSPAIIGSPSSTWTHHRRLSVSQQSKFINYLDEHILHIRRRFVQSHGLNDTNGYASLAELLDDVRPIIDFVWLSIEPNNAPMLSMDAYKQLQPPLFGQVDYLISIAGDMLDYLDKLEIKDSETAVQLLKLLNSLDSKFARLIDGTIPGGKPMSRTESVRLMAIAERSRFEIAGFFEKQQIEGFHYELSKLYEGVLDRTT